MTNHVGWLDQAIEGIVGSDGGNLGVLGFVFYIAMAIGGGLLIFMVFRWFYMKFQYEGHEEIYPVRLVWMGKEASLEGNLSVNDSFDEEVMEALEQHSDLKFAVDIVRDQIRRKELFVYNFKLTDEGDLTDSFSKKIRILSPDDITKPEYTWSDEKGKRSPMSILRREKRRNIVLYHTTRKITIHDEEGNEEDYYIISPVPMVVSKKIMGFDNKAISNTPVHSIEIKKLEGGKALATMATLAPILAEAIMTKVDLEQQRDKYANLYHDAYIKLNDQNLVINDQEHDLYQQEFVGKKKREEEEKPAMTFGWIVGGIFVSFIMYKLFPELLQTVDQQMSEIVGLGVGVLIIGIIWKYVTDSRKTALEKAETSKA